MELLERPSPNHDARPDGQTVDILLLHYTGMESAEAALARMCDPQAKVSAHYCIEEDGQVTRLVPEERRAWHAGVGHWAGATDINARSVGIELVNPGHEIGYRRFPDAQMAALTALAAEILARHPIPPHRVLGHADVAPLRKEDPGELFDWAGLARSGIGLWPGAVEAGARAPSEAEVARGLARFGYGFVEDDLQAVIRAFQRHFRPGKVDGEADAKTAAILAALVALVDAAGASS